MTRAVAIVFVLALGCLAGEGFGAATPAQAGPSGGERSAGAARAAAQGAGTTTFEGLAGGVTDTVPDGPVLLRLERLVLAPGTSLEPRTAAGPELLLVEGGTVTVSDAFGVEAALAAEAYLLLRPGVAYALRNGSNAPVSLLRLIVAATLGTPPDSSSTNDPIFVPGTPTTAAGTTVLWQSTVSDLPDGPVSVFLGRATWRAGSAPLLESPDGPVGFIVESGTLTVESPPGIRANLTAGTGILFPSRTARAASNEGDETAVALTFGVVPADEATGQASSSASAPDPSPAAGTDLVVAVDIAWEHAAQRSTPVRPIVVEATPGGPISLRNTGAAIHTFMVEGLDTREIALPRGRTVEYRVPADAPPGDYAFLCTVAGHSQAGQVGILRVLSEAAGAAIPTPEAAAGGTQGAATRDAPVTITGVDIAWEVDGVRSTVAEPARVRVSAGQTISLRNDGAAVHTFAVGGFDNVVVDLPIGETVEYTIPVDIPPGEYAFTCSVPGHAQAGMVGVLVVVPPA